MEGDITYSRAPQPADDIALAFAVGERESNSSENAIKLHII
jgi:hypothetical protein